MVKKTELSQKQVRTEAQGQIHGPFAPAYCERGERISRIKTGYGVFSTQNRALPETQIRTSTWITKPALGVPPPKETPQLLGPALFAGSTDKQFGFALLNGLGRLPWLDDLPPMTTLVYAGKVGVSLHDYSQLPRILRAFGVLNPVVVIEDNLRMSEVYTARELFGESLEGRALPGFYDWIDRQVPSLAAPDPDDRIYVTRSAMGPKAGRYVCEDHLEKLLIAEGYRIYAPEAQPLADQIATFQRAGRLIFAEGSAVHLFALLRQPGQISAVIQRRPSLPEIMQNQMADRAGTPTVAINTVTDLWWRPDRAEHKGLSVLDFDLMRDQLVAAGLITGRGWAAPSQSALDQSLRAGLEAGESLIPDADRAEWMKNHRRNRRK